VINAIRRSLDLLEIEMNPPISAKTFTFEPPQGMEKIDMPKVGKG
jgi:outer membrane lipoprotein-sorting protein